jgi:hypothetical protein
MIGQLLYKLRHVFLAAAIAYVASSLSHMDMESGITLFLTLVAILYVLRVLK